MRIWFALHWATGVPLTEMFQVEGGPPRLVGGHRRGGAPLVNSDALLVFTLDDGLCLWDFREEVSRNTLERLCAVHQCQEMGAQLTKRWKWQEVAPRELWDHFSVDLYSLISRELNRSNLAAAPPAEQPTKEGEVKHGE